MIKSVWDVKSQYEEYKNVDVFDCLIAEFLLCDGRYIPTIDATLKKYHVTSLDELAEKQQILLEQNPKLLALFTEIEMPLISVLYQMEQRGISINTEKLRSIGELIDSEIAKSEEEIRKDIGREINLNSPAQIGIYLVEKEGVPLARTKTGKYATGEQEMIKHSAQFPIIQKILDFRALTKLRSTYVDTLISKADESGRIHTTYHQVSVSTGRLASSNPNLQNIPVTSDMGQKIKACFEATEGYTLVSFDYSQQELRILAHLTGEEKLIEAFNENRDVHKTTASELFHVPYDEVNKAQRSVGKTINFGIIYGMSSFGMAQSLTIPVDTAQEFIDKFYATYPKIRKFYEQYLKNGKIHGFVETLFGRRRYVFEYPGQKSIDNSMRRVLMNYPIQGSAADLMKKAMIDISRDVLKDRNDIYLLLQIHDDLVFEIKDDDLKNLRDLIAIIREKMCGAYPLSVPVEVDVKVGKKWGEWEKQL